MDDYALGESRTHTSPHSKHFTFTAYERRSDHQIHEGFQSLPATSILCGKSLSFDHKKTTNDGRMASGGVEPCSSHSNFISALLREK
jgi:hypothetical protein